MAAVSIYLQGMEMPKSGVYILSVDQSEKTDRTVFVVAKLAGNSLFVHEIGVATQIGAHGRLIQECDVFQELDRFAGYLDEDMITRIKKGIFLHVPTVIQAEEAEK